MTESQSAFSASDIEAMPQRYRANFINSLSGFKSAALLGTTNGTTNNLAIVSSVVHIGANPPLLGMIMRPHTVVRHSLQNIKDNQRYTLNQVHTQWTDAAHQTSARYGDEESEFDAVGLTPWFSEHHSAPYVLQSPLKIGLTLEQRVVLCNETELIVGRIQEVFVNSDRIAQDGYVDIEQLGCACISGLDSYHSTHKIAQYGYAKPEQALTQK